MRSDPIGLAGGLNTYGYGGSPLRRIDPLGLVWSPNFEHGYRPKGYTSNGPFGGVCGAKGTETARWIPDIWWKNACAEHDKCYATCGKSKQECDNEFAENGARLYSFGLTKVFKDQSQEAYDNAQKEAGCEDCNE